MNRRTRPTAAAWIKRRARRLERAFQVSRREAVANAWQDWICFNPQTAGAARQVAAFEG